MGKKGENKKSNVDLLEKKLETVFLKERMVLQIYSFAVPKMWGRETSGVL